MMISYCSIWLARQSRGVEASCFGSGPLHNTRSLVTGIPRRLPIVGTVFGKSTLTGRPSYALRIQETRRQCFASKAETIIDINSLDLFFLRDSCKCSTCVDSSTRQKYFETSEIPLDLSIGAHTWQPDGSIQITWKNDIPSSPTSHTSIFPASFLSTALPGSSRTVASHEPWPYTAWQKSSFEASLHSLTIPYNEYMSSPTSLWKAISSLQTHGLIFLSQVPSTISSVSEIASRIGPLRNSFYGSTWDVRSIPSAKNVAYTNINLDFHMDLLYMADPPGIQFLHVLKQSTSGGESRFTDAVAAFERFQDETPELVDALVRFPTSYEYRNDGRWMQQTRYLLEGGKIGRSQPRKLEKGERYEFLKDYEVLNWSPQFQGVNLAYSNGTSEDTPSMKKFIKAAARFKELFASEEAVYEVKMEEGTCAIFNNRRVLHARRPFDVSSGERWLRGAYVDGDYLKDRYRVLGAEIEGREDGVD